MPRLSLLIHPTLGLNLQIRKTSKQSRGPEKHHPNESSRQARGPGRLSWIATFTAEVITSWPRELLRARARDILRNNPHANAAIESFVGNVIGAGIKPSSLEDPQPQSGD
ncbi:phage portal protein [Bradyrhizobium sp. 155]|uniref:phage portal protein n=1 Tax=Bradyrhizobium sp. 155 TaxID=2782629 RepID=UPI001FFF3C4D|nr:phage portal protein [Bradyrhizobium sp. 155]